jgi:hypothetical protein
MLLEADEAFLKEKGYAYAVSRENAAVHLVISAFPFPAAYTPRSADLLIRLPVGYPAGNPDMFWTRPDVCLASGAMPTAASAKETYLGVLWQRWSRHWSAGWRPGVDGLHTFVASIIRELERGI